MKKFPFEVKKTVSYWVEGAEYDLGVVNAMLRARKYPYTLFMGHLALEKLLKALVVKRTKAHAPFSHSLPYLFQKAGVQMPDPMKIRLSEFMNFISRGVILMRAGHFIRNARRDILRQGLKKSKRYSNG